MKSVRFAVVSILFTFIFIQWNAVDYAADAAVSSAVFERQAYEEIPDADSNYTCVAAVCQLSTQQQQCLPWESANGSYYCNDSADLVLDDYDWDYDDDYVIDWYSFFRNSSIGFAHLCSDHRFCYNVIIDKVAPIQKCKVSVHQ